MTVEEMLVKVEADLTEWLARVNTVLCKAKPGVSKEDGFRAGLIVKGSFLRLVDGKAWITTALAAVRDFGRIPESCESIEATCHAMAHYFADVINANIDLPPESRFDCGCFWFYPDAPDKRFNLPPVTERIKFSHN